MDGAARVWDASGGHELFALVGHTGELRSVSWSPDGRRLATASRRRDGEGLVCDRRPRAADPQGAYGLHPVGRVVSGRQRLATAGDDNTASVWDAAVAEAVEQWANQDRDVQALLARNIPRDPRAEGFVRSWLVLLPVPLDPGAGVTRMLDRHRLPEEANLRPRAGERVVVGGHELVWREHHSPEAVVDFNAVLGRTAERSLAYAVCYLESDQAHDTCGSRSAATIRPRCLNGREIYQCPVPRPLETLNTVGPVSLKEGTNMLVFKVANDESTWEGCVRLVDDAGRPWSASA